MEQAPDPEHINAVRIAALLAQQPGVHVVIGIAHQCVFLSLPALQPDAAACLQYPLAGTKLDSQVTPRRSIVLPWARRPQCYSSSKNTLARARSSRRNCLSLSPHSTMLGSGWKIAAFVLTPIISVNKSETRSAGL